MNKQFFIITGGSGTGKTSFAHTLIAKHHFVQYRVSTTRPQRADEHILSDYLHINMDEFTHLQEQNGFLYTDILFDHAYGVRQDASLFFQKHARAFIILPTWRVMETIPLFPEHPMILHFTVDHETAAQRLSQRDMYTSTARLDNLRIQNNDLAQLKDNPHYREISTALGYDICHDLI